MHLALIALFLTACSSCAGFKPSGRSAVDQHNTAVRIEVKCPSGRVVSGSGVLVSEDRVLTAGHVVGCVLDPLIPLRQEPTAITVYADDSHSASAKIEVEINSDDLARLRIENKSLGEFFVPARVDMPPVVGDRLCVVNAAPRWMYRCGEAQSTRSGRVGFSIYTEHGNSGSPIYDGRGRLVGILTNLVVCEPASFCAGYGTALAGYSWLVPE